MADGGTLHIIKWPTMNWGCLGMFGVSGIAFSQGHEKTKGSILGSKLDGRQNKRTGHFSGYTNHSQTQPVFLEPMCFSTIFSIFTYLKFKEINGN